MSFNPNDTNDNRINLGNYEEFFVLYMDNELSAADKEMVDEFLAAHPDLQAEFEILMSTKLPVEDFSFDKSELFADSMKGNAVGEDLLLYIDNELPADQKRVVELELNANKDYRFQHQLLLKAKLDAAEAIIYPNKEELYRRTERRIGFKPWMRVAAAAVVIAAMGVIYFNRDNGAGGTNAPLAQGGAKKQVQKEEQSQKVQQLVQPSENKANETQELASYQQAGKKDEKSIIPADKKENVKQLIQEQEPSQELVAMNESQQQENDATPAITKGAPLATETVASINIPNRDFNNHFINDANVTSSVTNSYNSSKAATPDGPGVATNGSDSRGSVKGFLRKATRMIEKRTGIDATNEDGKLLIGAVALKLK